MFKKKGESAHQHDSSLSSEAIKGLSDSSDSESEGSFKPSCLSRSLNIDSELESLDTKLTNFGDLGNETQKKKKKDKLKGSHERNPSQSEFLNTIQTLNEGDELSRLVELGNSCTDGEFGPELSSIHSNSKLNESMMISNLKVKRKKFNFVQFFNVFRIFLNLKFQA